MLIGFKPTILQSSKSHEIWSNCYKKPLPVLQIVQRLNYWLLCHRDKEIYYCVTVWAKWVYFSWSHETAKCVNNPNLYYNMENALKPNVKALYILRTIIFCRCHVSCLLPSFQLLIYCNVTNLYYLKFVKQLYYFNYWTSFPFKLKINAFLCNFWVVLNPYKAF